MHVFLAYMFYYLSTGMRKLALVFLFLTAFLTAEASHIVGGEFELLWISGNTYRLRLIYYFDVEHNPDRVPELEEPIIQVSIFQKFSNLRMRNVQLQFLSRTRVEYTQLSCASSELVTDKLIYSTTLTLTAAEFSSPNGYYIAWERCCRNYDINNIFSEQAPFGIYAGQTFYLEFPAVVKNGVPFINNSPRLFPPLNDFACPGIPYYVDFAGIDDDGDSLSYSLVTPLNTISPAPIPNQSGQNPLGLTNPAPYPEVSWRPGFGLNNIIDGLTNLTISTEGFLVGTPNTPGLYVFAVRCEEFRDGVKIGEIIRDFQMLVVEEGGCPFPAFPSIVGRKAGSASFTGGSLSVTFDNTLTAVQRCVEVSISDPSTLRPDEGNEENIRIKAVAMNFNKELLANISLSGTTATISNGGVAVFTICFPQCPFVENVPMKIGIVVYDDACALPLTDTLLITALIEPPANALPALTNSLQAGVDTLRFDRKIYGERIVIDVTGSDEDMDDRIVLRGNGIGFNAATYGATFTNKSGFGQLQSQFNWPLTCLINPGKKNVFEFLLTVVDSTNTCGFYKADSLVLVVNVAEDDNAAPELTATSENVSQPILDGSLTTVPGNPISIAFTGTDSDNTPQDNLTLELVEQSGNVEPAGFVFEPQNMTSPLAAKFTWEPDCSVFEDSIYENVYNFKFVLRDDRCYTEKGDTVTLLITVKDVDGSDNEFIPPNVFTPNGDDKNRYFAMVKEDPVTGELIDILPKDNCIGEFRNIRIYNRWGRRVYESSDRDFRWYGKDMPSGVYYYLITYSHKQYKGMVSILL